MIPRQSTICGAGGRMCARTGVALAMAGVLCMAPGTARADVALEWNAIAAATASSQTPFAQARFLAINMVTRMTTIESSSSRMQAQ